MKLLQSAARTLVLAPITAATTARTASLDTQGAEYVSIVVTIGAQANTNATPVALNLKENDDNSTTWSTFSSSFSTTVTNTTAKVAVLNVDMKGRKRYLQLSITPDTTTNGAVLSTAVASLDKSYRGASSGTADVVVVG